MTQIKSLVIVFITFILHTYAFGQVFSGTADMEGTKKQGFYTYLNTDEKYALIAWKEYLKKFGTIESGKSGSYIIQKATITPISTDPLTLFSTISEGKNKVKLFISIATGPNNYIQTGHEKFRDASNWLEEFVSQLNIEEQARNELTKLSELKSASLKYQKFADRLVRELDANKRQMELLTKKLEETKIEKEKILANQEQNKLDQKATESAITEQTKKVESAQSKIK